MTTIPNPYQPFRHVLYERDVPDELTDDDIVGADDWATYIDIPTPCTVCGGTSVCGYDHFGRPYIHVEEHDE